MTSTNANSSNWACCPSEAKVIPAKFPDSVSIFEPHPISEIAALLGEFLGIGVDHVSLTMFVSRASGRLGLPINLALYSEDPGAELMIADRIGNIVPETMKHVASLKQLLRLESEGFRDAEVVLIRGPRNLYRLASESVCRDTAKFSLPSVWSITDDQMACSRVGPTLALLAGEADRSLVGFGHHFSTERVIDDPSSQIILRNLMLRLKDHTAFACSFAQYLRAELKPSDALIVNRMLTTVAALRNVWATVRHSRSSNRAPMVTLDDYRATRMLLTSLPIPRRDSELSPSAAETAAALHEAIVLNATYQRSIPDNSGFGAKAFTRQHAANVSGLSYNTIKQHLKQLENEGIIESIAVNEHRNQSRVRRQGVQLYFRFNQTRSPPFFSNSQFGCLPTAEDIAANCGLQLQS